MEKENTKYTTSEVLVLIIAATFMGVAIGFFISHDLKINGKTMVRDPYLLDLLESYDNITTEYYQKIDKERILDGAMKGMMGSLSDEYANYFNKSENATLSQYLSGNYLGIGVIVTVTQNAKVYIDGVFKNTPADKANLKIGDEIISIDNKLINKNNLTSVINILKNDQIKIMTLAVKRNNKNITFNIKKASIEVPSVVSEKINKKVGYIGINTFSKNTPLQVDEVINKFNKTNIGTLIIDVRGNGGGYLNSLDRVMESIIKGKYCIYQIKDKNRQEKHCIKGKSSKKYKFYVLIDHNSASASELLASGLRDTQKALIVGEKSFGKGTVQKAVEMRSGGMYKYTIQNWLTSEGKTIEKIGIVPNIEIKMNNESAGDEQLDGVLQIINKG